MITVIVVLAIGYLLFHLGHSHANYRHGHHGVNMFWSSVRGPYITVPAAVDHPSEPSGRTPLQ